MAEVSKQPEESGPNGSAKAGVGSRDPGSSGTAPAGMGGERGGTTGSGSSSTTGSTTGSSSSSGSSSASESAAMRSAVSGLPGLPGRRYSFNALIMMGVLGFVVGRVCGR